MLAEIVDEPREMISKPRNRIEGSIRHGIEELLPECNRLAEVPPSARHRVDSESDVSSDIEQVRLPVRSSRKILAEEPVNERYQPPAPCTQFFRRDRGAVKGVARECVVVGDGRTLQIQCVWVLLQ